MADSKEIIIELRVRLAEELSDKFFSSKEEAVKMLLESAVSELVVSEDKSLVAFKTETKRLIAKDLSEAIEFLKNGIHQHCNEHDDLVGLSSKFNRTNEFLHKGLIDFATAEQEFVRIGNALLQLLKGLSRENIKK
ncbi:MAG: hypothetical protein J0M29_20535 [Chitinophagales bacterium]|nr:hypothetical protein [Chitinophagales bacterium]